MWVASRQTRYLARWVFENCTLSVLTYRMVYDIVVPENEERKGTMITYDEYRKNKPADPEDTKNTLMLGFFVLAIVLMYAIGSSTSDQALAIDPGTERHLTKWCYIIDVSLAALVLMYLGKIKTFFVLLFVGVISAFNKDAMLFFAFPLLLPVAMILIFARAVWGGLGILSKKILGHD